MKSDCRSNAVANAEPGLTPLSKFWITLLTSFQLERGVAPAFFRRMR